ncbi:hypothetical protein [Streptomyces sp. MZ04]|uniref:hypothetical protein n=1 Tax=Streptomyces sp. MZ04 TaxID=2559236 RepID=UPI00107ECD5C|nr:hypothetical protein [Streptomyces sp. MZ04]TGB06547.1 hypothetical protein E2651_23330 [Streptomyces sp. MZ04]
MTDDNIINFPRIGFSRPSGGGGQVPPPPTQPPAAGGTGRRSPLQIAAAVANPPAVRQGGQTPTTFRAGAPDDTGARLGALSMAAVLAVAVAALRGTVTVLEDQRQRRMQRDLELAPLRAARIKNQLAREQAQHAAWEAAAKNALDQKQARDKHSLAMRGIGDKAAEQRAKDNGKAPRGIPSSQEFGRKAVGGGKGASGGAGTGNKSAGTGSGRGSKAGAGTGPQSGKGRGAGADKGAGGGAKKPELGGGRGSKQDSAGKGPNGGKKSGDSKRVDKPGRQKSPMRGSQGAGTDLKKKTGQGKDEKGKGGRDLKQQPSTKKTDRTRLPRALKDTAQRAADRRLDKRRKNLDKPAAWKRDDHKAGPDSKKKHDLKKDAKKTPDPGKVNLTKKKPVDRNAKNGTGTPGRTKLWDAFKNDTKDAANDRWNKRGGDLGVPPLWKNDKKRQKKQAKQEQPRREQPKTDTTGPGRKSRWSAARDRVRNSGRAKGRGWMNDGCFGGTASPGAGTGQAGGGGSRPGTGSQSRRGPYENVSQSEPSDFKVWREDHVGAQAKTWESDDSGHEQQALPAEGPPLLPPAPEPHTQRPGTSGPIPMPPAPAQARTSKEPSMHPGPVGAYGGRRMDPQHATEITLDDAVDGGIKLKNDGLKTHQQSQLLSQRARKLRDTLRAFAEHLATQNNLVGVLFTSAMASLGESMEVLARMSDEMESKSFAAAEEAEGAANEMEDAYRPITQATADAGLTTPSAPAHNET